MAACLEHESLELLHESYRAGIAQGFFIEADRIVLKVVEAILFGPLGRAQLGKNIEFNY